MSVDPQVALLRKMVEPPSLHDALLQKFEGVEHKSRDGFTVRLLLCGTKVAETPIGPALENIALTAAEKANTSNPLVVDESADSGPRSVIIDYGTDFFQLLEGAERHVYEYLTDLSATKNLIKDTHILFFEDDVTGWLTSGWVNIDKVPPACLGATYQDKTDEEIADTVVHDLSQFRELGIAACEADSTHRTMFADNAKVNFPKLFPKACNIELYTSSGLFLTLAEFQQNFCGFPENHREVEVTHPMEDPLKF